MANSNRKTPVLLFVVFVLPVVLAWFAGYAIFVITAISYGYVRLHNALYLVNFLTVLFAETSGRPRKGALDKGSIASNMLQETAGWQTIAHVTRFLRIKADGLSTASTRERQSAPATLNASHSDGLTYSQNPLFSGEAASGTSASS